MEMVVSPVVKVAVAKLGTLLQKEFELRGGLSGDIRFISGELEMIARDAEDRLSRMRDLSAVEVKSMEELRDLAHDIEDCLDRFLPCAPCERQDHASFLHRLRAIVGTGSQFAGQIRELRQRVEEIHKRRKNFNDNAGAGGSQPAAASFSSTRSLASTVNKPVGIDGPKKELLELLQHHQDDHVDGQPADELKVISIVGFGGSGKTTLAKAVYDDDCGFTCRAWVEASKHRADDSRGLLAALLEQLGADSTQTRPGTHAHLQQLVRTHLSTQRYLIVFDDIEEQQWERIKSTFAVQARGRIIVTTANQQVAKACSSHGNGHVYSMRPLDAENSMHLLKSAVSMGKKNSPGLRSIMDKCDGHPLALVSVANFLQRKKDELTERKYEDFCRDLGYRMEREVVFTDLRRVLTRSFVTLPGNGNPLIRTCLQYMSVFPNGRPIRRNSLIRRWLAEGYVQWEFPRSDQEAADENMEELIDRNIIRPIDRASKDGKAKTCRAHGIIHEFMLRESMHCKFVTSLDDPQQSDFRHLFVGRNHRHLMNNSGSSSRTCDEKLLARSLTICGSAGARDEAVAGLLRRCELLRVLDLEECDDVGNSGIRDIHKWCLHLKYLSLGGTISRLPSGFDKLHFLETLDLRKTKVQELPVEVMRLPHLAHLFGKIVRLGKKKFFGKIIPASSTEQEKLQRFLSEKGHLQTLAGYVVDSNSPFPELMAHMRKLTKVKIWCDSSTAQDSNIWGKLVKAVNKFSQDGVDTCSGTRSLSLFLGNSLANFLDSLQVKFLADHSPDDSYGYLTSLKLHGDLSKLPGFVTSLCGLTELCLSSTNGLTANELSNLHKLARLNYLKLVQADLGGFVVETGNFPELLRLCLVVETPKLPTIKQGALPKLVSLQLLCEALDGLSASSVDIERFEHLQVVALDSKVNQEAIGSWENAARKHPKRPRVLFVEKVNGTDDDSMVKYVATEGRARR